MNLKSLRWMRPCYVRFAGLLSGSQAFQFDLIIAYLVRRDRINISGCALSGLSATYLYSGPARVCIGKVL